MSTEDSMPMEMTYMTYDNVVDLFLRKHQDWLLKVVGVVTVKNVTSLCFSSRSLPQRLFLLNDRVTMVWFVF